VVAPVEAMRGARIVIWTTTPWTIPGNRAVAYGPEAGYVVLEAGTVTEGAAVRPGDRVVVAAELQAPFGEAAGIISVRTLWSGKGADLAGTVCAHPLRGRGYDFDVPLLPADFVTMDQGTGFVHIAPGH